MYRIIGADGKEYGPITASQVLQWITEGRANAQTRAVLEGTTDWKPLTEFAEFSQAFVTTPGPAAAPSPAAPTPIQVAPVRKANPLALTGMILGIISMPFTCCCYGLPFNVVGLILSIIALTQIRQDPLNQEGKGMALAGLILSIVSIILAILVLILGLALSTTDIWRKIQRM